MAPNENAPQVLLLYNLLAAVCFGPRLYTSLQFRPSVSLTLHVVFTTCLFSLLAFMVIDASLDIMRLLYKLLGYLLQRMLDYDLETSIVARWGFPAPVEVESWVKLLLGMAVGTGATVYLIKANAGSWEAAKRNVAARHEAKTKPSTKDLTTAEQGGVAKEVDHGHVVAWATCAYMYSRTLLESKDWFMEVAGVHRDVEGLGGRKWERVCIYGPIFIAGAVALVRRRWIAKAGRVSMEEKKHVVEQGISVSEKQ